MLQGDQVVEKEGMEVSAHGLIRGNIALSRASTSYHISACRIPDRVPRDIADNQSKAPRALHEALLEKHPLPIRARSGYCIILSFRGQICNSPIGPAAIPQAVMRLCCRFLVIAAGFSGQRRGAIFIGISVSFVIAL